MAKDYIEVLEINGFVYVGKKFKLISYVKKKNNVLLVLKSCTKKMVSS